MRFSFMEEVLTAVRIAMQSSAGNWLFKTLVFFQETVNIFTNIMRLELLLLWREKAELCSSAAGATSSSPTKTSASASQATPSTTSSSMSGRGS
ncbi:hypothetical protein C5167_027941 [Papaver somniferum]|nr:hypothetical protein C5167_027941 [Papaver somniferum]